MKYIWIEESPNTASDCCVAPPKKGDDLRSRRGTTRMVEEHFPSTCRDWGGEKGSDGRTRDVGRLVGVGRSWRKRRVTRKGLTRPHAPVREMQSPVGKVCVADAWTVFLAPVLWEKLEISSRRSSWCGRCRKKMSPEKFAGKFIDGECFLTTIRLTGKFWETGKVTGMKHGHRKVTLFSIWLETISSSMVLAVLVLLFKSSDQDDIQKLKQHLFTHFQTKDLGNQVFLRNEIAQSSSGVVFSQRKIGEPLGDPGRYRRLVAIGDAVIRILRYIKSTPGQGVLYENRGHTQVVGYTDADWAGSPTDRRSTSGSSAEAKYRAMALETCELIWLRHLLQELRFGKDEQMKLICDN
ncbi:hypothetical protein CK203_097273 [Vitis vinifera]|uniref:Retrovirus-related Pol polyprotein from transposon RE1 n=1 Tax=Vitis vinifera TaxID=29760 RepID=A0A438DRF3_VITVI|nr:hypothetical protein CK203_097273 [Vitis vinifera]